MTLPRILVVEDNPVDVKMIKRALKLGGLLEDPHVVNDGAPAIALLAREKEYAHIPLPDLVLLDLNLITVDGAQVLRYIRGNCALDGVAVAILSSTPYDVLRSTDVKADCYFVKPYTLDAFDSLGRQILECYQRTRRCKSIYSEVVAPDSTSADLAKSRERLQVADVRSFAGMKQDS